MVWLPVLFFLDSCAMAERLSETEFAWYRLHSREVAVFAVLGLLLVSLYAGLYLTEQATVGIELESARPIPAARIQVNRAGVAELSALPGIGRKKAQAVIQSRRSRPIRSLEEFRKAAKGISAANLARIRPYVVFDD